MLMLRFYELYRAVDSEAHDPAQALVLAQRCLRDTTNDQKLRHWDDLRARDLMGVVSGATPPAAPTPAPE